MTRDRILWLSMSTGKQSDPWRLDDFVASLTASSPAHGRRVRGRRARLRRVGRAGRRRRHRRACSGRCCAATSRTSPRGGSRSAASPARSPHCAATSAGCSGRACSRSTRARRCRAPGGEGRLPRVLDGAEVDQLLDGRLRRRRRHRAGVADCQRDDAVLEVLYGSGVRVSELCGLDVDSRRSRRARAIVVWGKGGKQRRVPLSDPGGRRARVVAAVARRRRVAGRRVRALFANERGKRLTPRDVRRIVDRRSATPDPPARSPAQLRDSFARRRGRLAGGAGASRSCRRRDDAALHPRQQRTAAFGLRGDAPPRMRHVDIE